MEFVAKVLKIGTTADLNCRFVVDAPRFIGFSPTAILLMASNFQWIILGFSSNVVYKARQKRHGAGFSPFGTHHRDWPIIIERMVLPLPNPTTFWIWCILKIVWQSSPHIYDRLWEWVIADRGFLVGATWWEFICDDFEINLISFCRSDWKFAMFFMILILEYQIRTIIFSMR